MWMCIGQHHRLEILLCNKNSKEKWSLIKKRVKKKQQQQQYHKCEKASERKMKETHQKIVINNKMNKGKFNCTQHIVYIHTNKYYVYYTLYDCRQYTCLKSKQTENFWVWAVECTNKTENRKWYGYL